MLVELTPLKCPFCVTEQTEDAAFRHRRSYESRHKGKENAAANNAVKAIAVGRSNVFATENCTVVVAQIGGTAALPCVVRKFNNGVVSIFLLKTSISAPKLI